MKMLFLKDKAGGRGVENEREESPTTCGCRQQTPKFPQKTARTGKITLKSLAYMHTKQSQQFGTGWEGTDFFLNPTSRAIWIQFCILCYSPLDHIVFLPNGDSEYWFSFFCISSRTQKWRIDSGLREKLLWDPLILPNMNYGGFKSPALALTSEGTKFHYDLIIQDYTIAKQ